MQTLIFGSAHNSRLQLRHQPEGISVIIFSQTHMASIVQGYEYDIFISYRHNDNRPSAGSGGWVTDFVEALQNELAATIKEPLSIYFDKNSHDGLLETHNVDKSLEGKLKCLIFIPIISQTYCDPKSFAWQHEFCAFNKLAKEDQFGRDIKLSNGNVAGRILPIKIHELDHEDKSTIENEIGGVLRAIEFIYKEPGVNRPLTSSDDKNDNLNKTDYRNQINKVANSVKELITAIRHPKVTSTTARYQLPHKPTSSKKIVFIIISLLLIAAAYFTYQYITDKTPISTDQTAVKTLAVLPFVNMSNDPEQEYFSDGITDEVRNHLSKIKDLKVISRTSSMNFKGAKLNAKEIAEQLKVTNILEGSVQKFGNEIKITVQLSDATTDTHLWSETYEREFNDVFAIQAEIAQGVAAGLRTNLSSTSKKSLGEIPTNNIEAYNLYLKGYYEIQKVTPQSLEIGLKMLNQAIELDSNFALPYLGVANYYAVATDFFLAPDVAMPEVKIAAQTALEKDSLLTDTHGWYGVYHLWYTWDWKKAEEELIKGIELDGNKNFNHWMYSWLLSSKGKFEEAVRESGRTVELDPFDALLGAFHGLMYYYKRDYDKAIRELDRVRAFEPNHPFEHFVRGQVYSQIGRVNDAIEEQLIADKLFSAPWSHARLAYAYAIAGKKEKALEILKLLEKQSDTVYVASDVIATVYVALGDYDNAFKFLEKGFNERAGWMIWLKVDPIWDPIRKEKRFIDILERMNLK